MTETLKDRLIRHEGLKLKVYNDTMGVPTIGVGRNLVTPGISEDEAMDMLENDIVTAREAVLSAFPWSDTLDDIRKDILAEMAFQLGIHGVMMFTKMLSALKDGDYNEASSQMLNSSWHKQTPARCEELADLMMNG